MMTNLELMLSRSMHADPADKLIKQIGEHSYAILFGCASADFAVLKVAAQIEPCAERVLAWYASVGIRKLGDLTPKQLVSMGRSELVVEFLCSILDQEKTKSV